MLNFRKWNNFTRGSWEKIALYLNLILIYQNILVFEECFVLLLRHQLIIFIFNIPITSLGFQVLGRVFMEKLSR